MLNEFELIDRLKKKIPQNLRGLVGIGDDAGVFSGGKGEWLFTTDAVVDGVDFVSGKIKPQWAGRKALAVNLSDIAAMGGEPVAFVVTLGIPKSFSASWIEKFYEGMIPLAKKYRVQFLGGDITRAREFFASVAMIGRVASGRKVLRSGAKPGDFVAVTGKLGGSIYGHHYRFEPRLKEAQFLAREFKPTAMIDISDGFLQDLGHILKMSQMGACVDKAKIPVSKEGRTLEHALTDGEDFELLFTVASGKKSRLERAWKKKFPKVPLSWVGKITRRKNIEWVLDGKPASAPKLTKKGFVHF